MPYDQSIERVIAPPAESLLFWEECRQGLAARYPLMAVESSNSIVRSTLAVGESQFLNKGAFSRVYVLDDQRVLKFCSDLKSLQIMERLGTRSRFFPRVDRVLEAQAVDDENHIFHAAIVERLQEGYPVWMRSVIDGYRQPFRADSPIFASVRLLQMSSRILAGDIVVPLADVEDLAEAMKLLSTECLKELCLADIRTEVNIMMRPNGQVVIADPTHPILLSYLGNPQ